MGLFGVDLEREDVPRNKNFMISTRDNSDYKWQQGHPEIFGCLEVPSDPSLDVRGEYSSRPVKGKEDLLAEALRTWDEWKLKSELVKACNSIPPEYCCCGIMPDPDETLKKAIIPQLNKGWIRDVNTRLRDDRAGFKLNAYLWQWHNASGKSETNILLIRFFEEAVSDSDSDSDDGGKAEAAVPNTAGDNGY